MFCFSLKSKPDSLLAGGKNGIHLFFVFTGTGLYLHFRGGALLGKQSQMQTSERLLRKFIYSIGTHEFPVVICLWWKRHESTLGTWSVAQVEFKRLTQGWQAIKSLSQEQLVSVTFTGIFFGYKSTAASGVRKERNRHRGKEPQLQRNVSVFLSCCSLTISHGTKAPKQNQPTTFHLRWRCCTLSDKKRGTKKNNTPVFSVTHQGNCCRTNKTSFFQFGVLDSTKQSKAWPKASHFLVISILLQTVARAKSFLYTISIFWKSLLRQGCRHCLGGFRVGRGSVFPPSPLWF